MRRAARRFGSAHGPALYRETMMHMTDASNGAGLSNRRRTPLYRSGLWLCLISALLPIAGCATSQHQGSGDGQLASEQSTSFVADNTAGGAATGAVVGCVVGILLDALLLVATNGGGSLGIGCGAGGAVGGIAGGIDGYRQGEEAQTQAHQVLLTQSITKDIEKENAALRPAVQTAQRVVESDQRKLVEIKSDLEAKTISLDNAHVQAAFIRRNTAEISAILDDARKNRDSFIASRNQLQGGDTTALDQQIAQLNNQITQLETQLASVNAALTLTELD
jgi:hypothetical protein